MNADTFYLIGDTNGLCREDVQEAQRTKEEGNRRYRWDRKDEEIYTR